MKVIASTNSDEGKLTLGTDYTYTGSGSVSKAIAVICKKVQIDDQYTYTSATFTGAYPTPPTTTPFEVTITGDTEYTTDDESSLVTVGQKAEGDFGVIIIKSSMSSVMEISEEEEV